MKKAYMITIVFSVIFVVCLWYFLGFYTTSQKIEEEPEPDILLQVLFNYTTVAYERADLPQKGLVTNEAGTIDSQDVYIRITNLRENTITLKYGGRFIMENLSSSGSVKYDSGAQEFWEEDKDTLAWVHMGHWGLAPQKSILFRLAEYFVEVGQLGFGWHINWQEGEIFIIKFEVDRNEIWCYKVVCQPNVWLIAEFEGIEKID